MKKTLALLLALAMLFALCACGAEQAQEPAEEEPASAEVPAEEATEPAGEEAAAEEESAETEESVETQDAPQPEENYQTITELGVSLRIPESWSWSARKQAEGEPEVYYNFNEIAGDPHRTFQIGFMQIDLQWDDGGLSEDEKFEQIGSLLEHFNAAAADFRFSHTDDLYMGTAVLPLSGYNGRITVLVSETHKVIVSVAALESPEMSEEYLEAYQEILDSIVFS